ncbi:MAG: hypothetical protein ABEJ31_08215 [Haloarculaceae archaeon]
MVSAGPRDGTGRSIDRRSLLLGSGALVGLLAGCSSKSGRPSGDDGQSSPPTTSGTGTPQLSLDEFQFPDGATADGLSASLVDTHTATITGAESVTMSESGQVNYAGGHTQDVAVTKRISSAGVRKKATGGDVPEALWVPSGASKSYVRMDAGFEKKYRIDHTDISPDDALESTVLTNLLAAGDWGGAVDVVAVDGVPTAHYRAESIADERALQRVVYEDSYDGLQADVYVTQDGYVRKYDYDVSGTSSGRKKSKNLTTTFGKLGETTVSAPEWLSTAKSDGYEFEADVVQNNRVVQFTDVNGPDIDGLRASVSGQGTHASGRVSETVSEGDTLNLAITEGGTLSTAIDEMPAQTTSLGDYVYAELRDGKFTLFSGDL